MSGELENELEALRLCCYISPAADLRSLAATARKKGRQDRLAVIEDVMSLRGLQPLQK